MLCWLSPAFALEIEAPLPTPAQETRAQELFREFRCVVCQGESIADSGAEVAQAMRHEVRRQVASGKTDEEVVSYFVSGYGDSILMHTPFNSNTALLWLLPLILLVLGGGMAFGYFRRHAK